MFLRYVKTKYGEYLYLVHNYWDNGRHRQRVVYSFGRRDKLDPAEVFAVLPRYAQYRFMATECGPDGCPPTCHHMVKTKKGLVPAVREESV